MHDAAEADDAILNNVTNNLAQLGIRVQHHNSPSSSVVVSDIDDGTVESTNIFNNFDLLNALAAIKKMKVPTKVLLKCEKNRVEATFL